MGTTGAVATAVTRAGDNGPAGEQPEPKRRGRITRDAELAAMQDTLEALIELDVDARRRVLRFLVERLGATVGLRVVEEPTRPA